MSAESMSNCDHKDISAQIPETLSSRPRKVVMCLLKYPLNKFLRFKTTCLNTHIVSNHGYRAALCERWSPTVTCEETKGEESDHFSTFTQRG